MTILLLGTLKSALLGWLMGFLSLFLILLILIQRGKGGGLTGALGGPGGQSAFGSKAGDTFTFITIIVASVWGFTCAFTMWLLGTHTPTTVSESNISAGPGDEEATDVPPAIPPESGSGLGTGGLGPGSSLGDLGELGGLSSGELPETTDQTPPQNLTPAPDTAAPDSPPVDEPPSTDSPAEDSPAEDSTSAEADGAETADDGTGGDDDR